MGTDTKTAIVDAARDVIQIQGTPPRNEWWDEECKKITQEKNEARKKWLRLKTRISWNTYFNKRNQANKVCRQKKKKWLYSSMFCLANQVIRRAIITTILTPKYQSLQTVTKIVHKIAVFKLNCIKSFEVHL